MSKRNPIEITFYFNTIEEAIATLGSLVQKAAPVATLDNPAKPLVLETPVVKPRKPRADAGKPRGPYKNVEAPAADAAVPAANAAGPAASTPESAASGPGGEPGAQATTVTAPGNGEQQASTQTATPASPGGSAAPIPADTEIQAALERLFAAKGAQPALQLLAEFGVKRGRDLKPEQRADFIKKADAVASA